MKLIYCYIEEFRNIFDQEFNFSIDYECHFRDRRLSIRRRRLDLAEEMLLDDFQKRMTLIVGKTGTGKSNILQLIGMPEEHRLDRYPDARYLMLYADERNENRYVAECHNVMPKGVLGRGGLGKARFIEFEYADGKIRKSKCVDTKKEHGTVVVYSYDRNSVSPRLFPEIHVDGAIQESRFFQRFTIPFERSNVGVACWFVREMIEDLPEDNVKRDAALEIASINWSERLNVKLPDDVMAEYRFYHDNLYDKSWKSVLDVPRFFEDNRLPGDGVSEKEKFVHDLLTDFALYLRKWAQTITPVTERRLAMYRAMGMIRDLGIDDFASLPDGKCDDLKRRIDWLCQYIDVHTDELNANQGLLWQIGSDIIDIADLFGQFDDECFSEGVFRFYVEDMDCDANPLRDLFERMSGYRADQLGAFTSELLPFEIVPLSSGEYQYARVLGIVNEFTAKSKMGSRRGVRPDSIVLLLDEPETFMHPEMCRKFLYWVDRIITDNLKDVDVQLIMTTHSPFMLSDAMPSQIIRISVDDDGCCRQIGANPDFKTYAGDIHAIMANDFFFDYSIGELSRIRVMTLIDKIKEVGEREVLDEDAKVLLILIREMAQEIGDRLLRESMILMIDQILRRTNND